MIWAVVPLPGVCHPGADRRGPLGAGPRPRAPAHSAPKGVEPVHICGARPVALRAGVGLHSERGLPVRLQARRRRRHHPDGGRRLRSAADWAAQHAAALAQEVPVWTPDRTRPHDARDARDRLPVASATGCGTACRMSTRTTRRPAPVSAASRRRRGQLRPRSRSPR